MSSQYQFVWETDCSVVSLWHATAVSLNSPESTLVDPKLSVTFTEVKSLKGLSGFQLSPKVCSYFARGKGF